MSPYISTTCFCLTFGGKFDLRCACPGDPLGSLNKSEKLNLEAQLAPGFEGGHGGSAFPKQSFCASAKHVFSGRSTTGSFRHQSALVPHLQWAPPVPRCPVHTHPSSFCRQLLHWVLALSSLYSQCLIHFPFRAWDSHIPLYTMAVYASNVLEKKIPVLSSLQR